MYALTLLLTLAPFTAHAWSPGVTEDTGDTADYEGTIYATDDGDGAVPDVLADLPALPVRLDLDDPEQMQQTAEILCSEHGAPLELTYDILFQPNECVWVAPPSSAVEGDPACTEDTPWIHYVLELVCGQAS
ncbi:MAG: hypothetical protein ACI8PZ_005807 [Myxococcota bacterium]|jgi:hypothetical protein